MDFNGTTYAYHYSLQGDVLGLYDNTGTLVVRYLYDAWGVPLGMSGTLATTLGVLQPFRYRGYEFDQETGLYYLRARYYRAEWGRFICADATLLGNLYSYSYSNPIQLVDPSGRTPERLRPEGESVLVENRKPKGVRTKVPLDFFLACLDEMVELQWDYVDGAMRWGEVDCVGMIRFAYQQHSQYIASKRHLNGTTVYHLYKQSEKEVNEVRGNENLIQKGYAIYWYDPSEKYQINAYIHIGIYMSEYVHPRTGEIITDAVIHSSVNNGYVEAESLSKLLSDADEKGWVLYYGPLADVQY